MIRLGLDLGTAFVKAVLIDEQNAVCHEDREPCIGDPLAALTTLVERLRTAAPSVHLQGAVTGQLRSLLESADCRIEAVSDVAAAATAAAMLEESARDIIVMGGQHALWCRVAQNQPAKSRRAGDWTDFALSDLCAAGAGSFLAQQAGRLGFTPEGLGDVAATAERAPSVAGRCAVFTKSDIIHLQQKGTPVEEIALGLCRALVRTFQAQVLRGRRIEPPLVFAGGCARNRGMVRAIKEIFELRPEALIVPKAPEMVPALGAAVLASKPVNIDQLFDLVDGQRGRYHPLGRTAPLAPPGTPPPEVEPRGEHLGEQPVILGVDVGSVSTNLVLVGLDGVLLDAVYLKTRGRPLDALREGLTRLTAHRKPNIVGVGATGSGRHLAAHFLGADVVKNEITAQLRAAVSHRPDVDTVLEIGGQDAKYIQAQNGRIVDFTMNLICAAGTGSFLEEQADILKINIVDEFSKRALRSKAPLDLGRRCTVFMESALTSALATGASVNDASAGLAISIARNYLERVVGGRPIGEKIVFQGGTAANRAVVAAFEQILGRPVAAHPHARVSGAVGAALLVLDAQEEGLSADQTQFRGWEGCDGELIQSFECKKCSAGCQVNRFRAAGEVLHFGDICERYSARDRRSPISDPLAVRTALLLEASGMTEATEPPENAIGILRASHTMAMLPWLAQLVRAIGKVPYLSPATTAGTVADGGRAIPSDTCLPIKAAFGHAVALKSAGIDTVLAPAVAGLTGQEGLSCSCIFGHHLPWLIADLFEKGRVLSPELNMDLPKRHRVEALRDTAATLGLSKGAVKHALADGDRAALKLQNSLTAWGEEILGGQADRIAVVMGRPYMLSDPFLNMGLGSHLARMGFSVIPMDALPLDTVRLSERWQDLPWRFTRDLIRAAHLVLQDRRLFPVILSSFGCGPDAFTLKHLQRLLKDRPHLVLEMDEHRSEAGLLTRLEAFTDEIAAHTKQNAKPTPVAEPPIPKLTRKARLIMPHFADHVFGHSGIMRAAGFEVIVLPPPTRAVRERGEALSSGKECHPFAMIAGDLLTWLEGDRARADDVFFYPGTVVSCLLRQYGDGLNLILDRLNANRIRIVTPSLDSWAKLVGLPLTIRMQAAQVAGDVLLRALCRIRPYETTPGEADAAYRTCLTEIASAAAKGNLFQVLETCAERFAAIETQGAARPVVGVAGDVYTRINEFASNGLFSRLEAAGCEVWPAPFGTDVAELNATRRRAVSLRLKRPGPSLRYTMARRVMTRQRQKIDRIFSIIDGMRPERSVFEVQEMVRPYLGSAANSLIVLNIARMLTYAKEGAAGILNASCINCMVGSASEAFQARIRREMGEIPISSLIYGGGTEVNQSRLDAFVHQVKRFHEKKSRASEGG